MDSKLHWYMKFRLMISCLIIQSLDLRVWAVSNGLLHHTSTVVQSMLMSASLLGLLRWATLGDH